MVNDNGDMAISYRRQTRLVFATERMNEFHQEYKNGIDGLIDNFWEYKRQAEASELPFIEPIEPEAHWWADATKSNRPNKDLKPEDLVMIIRGEIDGSLVYVQYNQRNQNWIKVTVLDKTIRLKPDELPTIAPSSKRLEAILDYGIPSGYQEENQKPIAYAKISNVGSLEHMRNYGVLMKALAHFGFNLPKRSEVFKSNGASKTDKAARPDVEYGVGGPRYRDISMIGRYDKQDVIITPVKGFGKQESVVSYKREKEMVEVPKPDGTFDRIEDRRLTHRTENRANLKKSLDRLKQDCNFYGIRFIDLFLDKHLPYKNPEAQLVSQGDDVQLEFNGWSNFDLGNYGPWKLQVTIQHRLGKREDEELTLRIKPTWDERRVGNVEGQKEVELETILYLESVPGLKVKRPKAQILKSRYLEHIRKKRNRFDTKVYEIHEKVTLEILKKMGVETDKDDVEDV